MTAHFSKSLLLLALTVMIHSFVSAQNAKPDTTIYTPKWEVGLDLLGLFNENNVPKASIFFRRNYDVSNQKCKAWRFRIGMDSEVRDGYAFDTFLLGDYTTYGPYLSVGHEWRQKFKRYDWYFATDVSGRYLFSNQYYLVSGDDLFYDDKIRDFDIAFNGILGFQHRLMRNFSIGVESSFSVTYSEQHYDSISNDKLSFGEEDHSKLTTKINPFMTINLFYTLQNHKK